MRNIILFVRRFSTLVLFLILQAVCIGMLAKSNGTYEALLSNSASEITGSFDKQYNDVQYFFHLKQTNRLLADENVRLRNELAASFRTRDTSKITHKDSGYKEPGDTSSRPGRVRLFTWLPAKVVRSTVTEENNYITLDRGSEEGAAKDMAVVGPGGTIAGRVVMVSPHFARVMSLLNHYSKVSATIKRSNYNGSIEWDGKDPAYLILRNIPKSAQARKGDTVLTSSLSGSFQPGLLIGTVSVVEAEQSSNYYTLKVKSATNFYTLQYAYLVENTMLQEQRDLESKTPKVQ